MDGYLAYGIHLTSAGTEEWVAELHCNYRRDLPARAKEVGARWNGFDRCWWAPREKASALLGAARACGLAIDDRTEPGLED